MPKTALRSLALALCVAALLASPALAEGPKADTPEAAFQSFFDRMRANDWAGCAGMMHPEALSEFHSLFVTLSEQDDTGQVGRMFLGIEKPEDAKAITPEKTFANVMKSMTSMNPGMEQIFGTATADVLGSVTEGDVVHVVYRMHMTIEGAKMSKIAVAPFKPVKGKGWRGMLTGDMESMIQALGAQLGG